MTAPDPTPSAALAGILEEIRGHLERAPMVVREAHGEAEFIAHARVVSLVAALEAVLEQADDLMRKSEALDAEAEYITGEHPEAAAVAVLKRERSIAYDECARWIREAITTALTGTERSDGA